MLTDFTELQARTLTGSVQFNRDVMLHTATPSRDDSDSLHCDLF